MKYTKTKKQIPTLRLSKTLFEEMCAVLENENKKFNQDEKNGTYGVKYQFSDKDVTVRENNANAFISNIPNSSGNFTVEFESKNKDIRIEMSDRDYDWNNFSVSGDDATWVFGITQQLERIFKKYKTINHIFYTKKAWPIFIICTIALFFTISISLDPFISNYSTPEKFAMTIEEKDGNISISMAESYLVALIVAPHSAYLLWPAMFKRLFPIMEGENAVSSKIKNLLLYMILGITSSIIAGAFFYLF